MIEKTFISGIRKYAKKHSIFEFVLITPVEDYVHKNFQKIQKKLKKQGITLSFTENTESFFLSHDEFKKQYKKPPIMEYFYRFMRKRENILMTEDGKPEGGEWNYDKENRKFDRKHERSWDFNIEKNKYWKQAEEYYSFTSKFIYPTNRAEALKLLDYFLENHLDNFGRLEDAMYEDDAYVHHSLLSSSINF